MVLEKNTSEVFESTVRDTKDHCSSTANSSFTVSKTEHNSEIVLFLIQKKSKLFLISQKMYHDFQLS